MASKLCLKVIYAWLTTGREGRKTAVERKAEAAAQEVAKARPVRGVSKSSAPRGDGTRSEHAEEEEAQGELGTRPCCGMVQRREGTVQPSR